MAEIDFFNKLPYALASIRAGLIERDCDPVKVARISFSLPNWRALGRAIKEAAGLPVGEIDVSADDVEALNG